MINKLSRLRATFWSRSRWVKFNKPAFLSHLPYVTILNEMVNWASCFVSAAMSPSSMAPIASAKRDVFLLSLIIACCRTRYCRALEPSGRFRMQGCLGMILCTPNPHLLPLYTISTYRTSRLSSLFINQVKRFNIFVGSVKSIIN